MKWERERERDDVRQKENRKVKWRKEERKRQARKEKNQYNA